MPSAHDNLGIIYEQQGRLDGCLSSNSRRRSRIGPTIGLAHFHMGRILANQEKYDDAIQHFLKTLTPEDENTPRYLYALGATYARAGDIAECADVHAQGAGAGRRHEIRTNCWPASIRTSQALESGDDHRP